ncbi:MAG: catalase/peroxidase HPI [Deltaproteobacteria bacterium]|nr:MAG: catalase/peroxidase HPI [Deltaproteobacteria bacterium]
MGWLLVATIYNPQAIQQALADKGTTQPAAAKKAKAAPAKKKAHKASAKKANPHYHHGHHHKADKPMMARDWWPNMLDLRVLKANAPKGDPMDASFNYRKEFLKLDMKKLKADIKKVLTTSKKWWPADFGHYGGLMIRLAWHSAGTYRVMDGRGGSASGTIRFAPLNSWPDNANLDKARRLLWPIKRKYGRRLSWADLFILSGTVALESMGLKTFGFGGGRVDVYEPTDINWGSETRWLSDEARFKGKSLKAPFGATMMGLIYVNPEGPNGKPDPLAAAQRIRVAFGRMGMNDVETVALIAGGHTLGKCHGAASSKHLGKEPAAAPMEQQGLGWKNKYKSGKGAHTTTSGLEGAWTSTPALWNHQFFHNLFTFKFTLTKSPAGAKQWVAKKAPKMIPDAHIKGKYHHPFMLTTDLALVKDPKYRKISERFHKNPKEFDLAFAKAWFKLTHRDMGPHSRLLGPEVPKPQIWQDPVPAVNHKLVGKKDIAALKKQILATGLSVSQLVKTAWASASTYRDTDYRGGANGARLRLAPQKSWKVNEPAELSKVLAKLTKVQADFNKAQKDGKKISMADLIVLAGAAAIEKAAKAAGQKVVVPFTPGRTDATAKMTDAASFEHLKPAADGFRNYWGPAASGKPQKMLVERADMLTLTVPEMTVLVGGLRVLNANHGGSKHGVFTKRPGVLSNDFFVNLVDMDVKWKKKKGGKQPIFVGTSRTTGKVKWTATAVDLIFGANAQLRAVTEVYASDDAKAKFVNDFVKVWTKVMRLDRFDLAAKK